MTPGEQGHLKEYGTAYPCCGNCEYIRRAGYKLMCKRNFDYRDFDSIKCYAYRFKEYIPQLEELC